jgi:nucleotide-binding universal stress UspA family protein
MKTLLVPTDFSDNAAVALDYAIDLANHWNSRLIFVNAYHVATSAAVMVSVESIMRADAEADMSQLLDTVRPRLHGEARAEGHVMHGDAIGTVTYLCKKEAVDLVIMGTQGASGLKEIFSGSTANGIIKHARVPVLAIPAGHVFTPFKTMVLAVDQAGLSSSSTLTPLLSLAKNYAAAVRVYHKDTGETDKGIDPIIEMFLESVEHTFHYELDGDVMHERLHAFVDEYHADLLCMIRRQRSFLESLFHPSATTREMFKIRLPLLILQD